MCTISFLQNSILIQYIYLFEDENGNTETSSNETTDNGSSLMKAMEDLIVLENSWQS